MKKYLTTATIAALGVAGFIGSVGEPMPETSMATFIWVKLLSLGLIGAAIKLHQYAKPRKLIVPSKGRLHFHDDGSMTLSWDGEQKWFTTVSGCLRFCDEENIEVKMSNVTNSDSNGDS